MKLQRKFTFMPIQNPYEPPLTSCIYDIFTTNNTVYFNLFKLFVFLSIFLLLCKIKKIADFQRFMVVLFMYC